MRGEAEPTVGAVVFDWAGTVVDFGSLAPAHAFIALFERHGVPITVTEARRPMGLPKWEHIQAVGAQPRVAQAWREAHGGHPFDDAVVGALYAEYTPINREVVLRHADLVPGAAATVAALRDRAIRIGSTTGYAREIIAPLLPLAREQGFEPDNLVCSGDVSASRPTPLAMYRSFLELQVWPAWRVVKVDDTLPGLMEGKHAGCWTVAVTDSGNEVGLSLAEWTALDGAEQLRRRAVAADRLGAARPDFTIATVAGLPALIDEIERRLRAGARPAT
jgi:phosphonoacetaldehyde hydrolase